MALRRAALVVFVVWGCPALAAVQPPAAEGAAARTVEHGVTNVLPFSDFHYEGTIGRTIADSDPPEFPQPPRPPKGAPNVVLILIDDAGYGQFGTFGGAIPTINGQQVGQAHMAATLAITLGLGGTLDVGLDTGSAVDEEACTPPFEFNGTFKQVTVKLQP